MSGTPLRLRLLTLLAVPLLGVGVLATADFSEGLGQARAAGHAEQAVRLVRGLSAARSALGREIVPGFARALQREPGLGPAVGLSPSALTGVLAGSLGDVAAARHATDVALDLLPATAGLAVPRARSSVRSLRDTTDTIGTHLDRFGVAYFGYASLSNSLATAQNDAIAKAVIAGLTPDGVAAVRDVQQVAVLVEVAGRQVSEYQAAYATAPARRPDALRRWLADWGGYTTLVKQIEGQAAPAVRAALQSAQASPAAREFDKNMRGAIDITVAGVRKLPIAGLVQFTQTGLDNDVVLAAVLSRSIEVASAATSRQHAAAVHSVRSTVVLTALLLLSGCGAALLVSRTVSRPLRRLADQAALVSEGQLVSVRAAGPREVRTLARALAATVESLRRVQHQAEAVAEGELTSEVLHQPLSGPLGAAIHASMQQITGSIHERERLQADLTHQAAHDSLTGLPNRSEASTMLRLTLDRDRRSGTATGLLFIDLDNFKKVNDAHGHAVGDEVLRTVAARMNARVRKGDVLARLGGDEFIVIAGSVTSEAGLLALADELIAVASEPLAVLGTDISVGASVGVAVSRDGHTDASHLLNQADLAVYRAKTGGRGRAEVFDDALRHQLAHEAEMTAAIHSGLAAGEFVLYYQPVLETASGRLRGFEALIRWQRPDHGMVPPDDFIPVAEGSTSLICEIGRYVLREATAQLLRFDSGLPASDTTVAVNISGRHLASRTIVDDVTAALAASGLAAHRLVLEITETVLVDDPVAIEHLLALRQTGVAISIDDFGTGYTSIGQLQRLPVDVLKIDKSFVSAMDTGGHELVELIVRAAHAFNLSVVAEGVETDEQLRAMRALGCDCVQGYLLHRPMPAAAVPTALLAAGKQAQAPLPQQGWVSSPERAALG